MSLYHKYRPSTLDQVRGNEETIESIQKMLSKTDPPHVYLLIGPTGCGKTTIARIIAGMLDCNGNDLKEIDSGQFRGIDTIREIRQNCSYLPLEGKGRGWILDEFQKLTGDAQNASLKLFEDPPAHAYFFICTNEPQKVIETIKGRCIIFTMQLLNDSDMSGLLRKIVRNEGETLAKEVYEQIVQDAQGHPRNAINILEMVLSSPSEKRLNIAKQTAEKQNQAIELCRALIKRARWGEVSKILNGLRTEEPETIRRIVLGYFQSVLLKDDNVTAGLILEMMEEPFYNGGFPLLVLACYRIVKND